MPGREEQRNKSPAEIDPYGVINQGIEQLLAELRQGRSQRLENYLAFTARFRHYSAHNQMLIFMQCPEATYVAGYKTWQEMGYQVARGEKGIRILAPRPYKKVPAETQEEEARIYFVTVAVFDASQLADLGKKPLPIFFTPLGDDQQELSARVAQVVAENGIIINEQETGRAQGYSAGRRIAISEGLDSRNRVLTLIHEYAHELLHWDEEGKRQSKQVKECQAEAVSYVVAHHFGIHNPFSADYLQSWGNTPKELLAELETVRRTAAYIIERIEQPAVEPTSHEEMSS